MSIIELINFLQTLEKEGYLTDDVKNTIKNIGIKTKYGPSILEHLNNNCYIDDKTFEDGSASGQILNILVDNNDVHNYLKYIQRNVTLTSLPNIGNLYEYCDLNKNTLQKLLQVEGKEGGRGVGKGEIFLAVLFQDVTMRPEAKGDLSWNNLYLEVKGSDARLGDRDREYTNYEESKLNQLSKSLDLPLSLDLVTTITSLYVKHPEVVSKLLDAIYDFCQVSYPYSNVYDINVNYLSDNIWVRHYLTKIYFSNYINKEKVDAMIFINTKRNSPNAGGNYIKFMSNEMERLVEEGAIACGRIKVNDLDPNLLSPPKK
jgi:hypothetical protein